MGSGDRARGTLGVTRTRLALALGVAALIAPAGCGGGGSGPETSATTTEPQPQGLSASRYVQRADAVCRDALRETRKIGQRFLISGASLDPLMRTTKLLVEPAIRIRERQARRLRQLGPPPDPALQAYLDLFDPIDSLMRMRAEAGRAGDVERAHTLEQLILDLGDEQRRDASDAGLNACDANFVRSAFAAPSG
jgi:hypothetical protein